MGGGQWVGLDHKTDKTPVSMVIHPGAEQLFSPETGARTIASGSQRSTHLLLTSFRPRPCRTGGPAQVRIYLDFPR